MPLAGFTVATLAVGGLIAVCALSDRPYRFGFVGWAGLVTVATCAVWLASPFQQPPILSALAWSGYVAAADSAVFSMRGRSLMRSGPRAFVWLAAISIFLWLPFEWYNLHLAAWYRSGLPAGPVRYLVLGWSFSCIWPVLFETADLFLAVANRDMLAIKPDAVRRFRGLIPVVVVGAGCLALPLLVPRLDVGEHLLGLTAVGFLLVLDPLNAARGDVSLWREWSNGGRALVAALAAAGVFCGLVADGFNYMADARWHSISTFGAGLRLFELPLAAYLACAAFGPQAFAMHVCATGMLNLPPAWLPSRAEDGANGTTRGFEAFR